MSEAPRLLSDVEFAKLTTEEKYSYLNEMVKYLLSHRAKREEAPAKPLEVSPAKPEIEQSPPPPEE